MEIKPNSTPYLGYIIRVKNYGGGGGLNLSYLGIKHFLRNFYKHRACTDVSENESKMVIQIKYCLQSMYNHMVGRTTSVIFLFYSLLPGSVHDDETTLEIN